MLCWLRVTPAVADSLREVFWNILLAELVWAVHQTPNAPTVDHRAGTDVAVGRADGADDGRTSRPAF